MILEITRADLAIAGLCVSCWVLGGAMWTGAGLLWLARRLGLTWRDLLDLARGR